MNKNIKDQLFKQHDYCAEMAYVHSERYRKENHRVDWENYRYWDGRREGIRIALELLEGDD